MMTYNAVGSEMQENNNNNVGNGSSNSSDSASSVDNTKKNDAVDTGSPSSRKRTLSISTTASLSSRDTSTFFRHLKNNWKILLSGQVLSLLLASAGAAQATLHLDCGLSAPTFTMTMIYFGLSSFFFILLWRRRRIARQPFTRGSTKDGIFQDPADGSLVLNDTSTGDGDDGTDEDSNGQEEELEMTNMGTPNKLKAMLFPRRRTSSFFDVKISLVFFRFISLYGGICS